MYVDVCVYIDIYIYIYKYSENSESLLGKEAHGAAKVI